MNYPINIKDVKKTTEFHSEVIALHTEAISYLSGFKWCKQVKDSFLYTNLGRVFCIFLFEIDNSSSAEDNFLWVIVGDIPPMYLDTFGPKTTKEVLEDYIRLSEDWISNVKVGKQVDNCFPLDSDPTIEMADLLESRILFMKNDLLDNIEDVRRR